ncbi:MAG: hypothetical protein RH859_08100 [Longimicrobiales bacterium]
MTSKQPSMAGVALLSLLALPACDGEVESPSLKTGPGLYTIEGESSCAECEIVLEDIAVLGAPEDSTSIREDAAGRGCMVGQLSTGEFVVSGSVGGGQLVVYAGSGPSRRSIGRRGRGPGEFGSVLRVWVGPGDTLFVADERNARIQVLTAEGEFVRSFAMPAPNRPFTRLRTGNLLFHTMPSSTDDATFQLVDRSGEPLADLGRPALDEVEFEGWVVSPAPSALFWAASMWEYELYEWESADSIKRTVRRVADWFPGGVWFSEELYERDRPGSYLIHVWEDESGLLWVYSGVPDADWAPNEARVPDPDWYEQNFDVVIEVVDLGRERVVASTTVDYMLGAVCGRPLMYTVEWSDRGDTRTRVVRPRLHGYEEHQAANRAH